MDFVEKYDKLRLLYAKTFAISFMIWHALFTYTLNFSIENRPLKILIITIELAAALVWGVYLIKLQRLSKKINRNKELRDALNNELHKHLGLKSARVALISFIVSIGILIGLLSVLDIPAILICQILLFIVISSLFISNIIFHNNC